MEKQDVWRRLTNWAPPHWAGCADEASDTEWNWGYLIHHAMPELLRLRSGTAAVAIVDSCSLVLNGPRLHREGARWSPLEHRLMWIGDDTVDHELSVQARPSNRSIIVNSWPKLVNRLIKYKKKHKSAEFANFCKTKLF